MVLLIGSTKIFSSIIESTDTRTSFGLVPEGETPNTDFDIIPTHTFQNVFDTLQFVDDDQDQKFLQGSVVQVTGVANEDNLLSGSGTHPVRRGFLSTNDSPVVLLSGRSFEGVSYDADNHDREVFLISTVSFERFEL